MPKNTKSRKIHGRRLLELLGFAAQVVRVARVIPDAAWWIYDTLRLGFWL